LIRYEPVHGWHCRRVFNDILFTNGQFLHEILSIDTSGCNSWQNDSRRPWWTRLGKKFKGETERLLTYNTNGYNEKHNQQKNVHPKTYTPPRTILKNVTHCRSPAKLQEKIEWTKWNISIKQTGFSL
jgi:hypothetical protein